ncbi:MAG TPA: hypothetical protein DIV47_02475 [Candidatus Pacebacteria bacterium]|nr:hypothetical protein [Candidatus Paceibacterota bacterium]
MEMISLGRFFISFQSKVSLIRKQSVSQKAVDLFCHIRLSGTSWCISTIVFVKIKIMVVQNYEDEVVPSRKIEVPVRGLPDGVFDLSDPSDKVVGLVTGAQILRQVGRIPFLAPNTDTAIYLHTELDEDKEKFGFLVEVQDDTVEFDIITRIGGKLGRDFYARDLIVRSVADFRAQGVKIDHYKSKWDRIEENQKRSVNYATFFKKLGIDINNAVEQIDAELKEKEQAEVSKAAFSTWTGEIAKSLGFGEIESLKPSAHQVEVVFKKTEDVEIVKKTA